MKKFIEKHSENFGPLSNAIGQLITVFHIKKTTIERYKKPIGSKFYVPPISVCTMSIVNLKGYEDAHIGLTCLHGLQNVAAEFVKSVKFEANKALKVSDYNSTSFFLKYNSDITDIIVKIEKEIQGQVNFLVSKDDEKLYEDRYVPDLFLKKLKERYLKETLHFIVECTPNKSFLEIRKRFFDTCIESKEYEPLVDPKYKLQPIPGIDIAFIDLPNGFLDSYTYFLTVALKNSKINRIASQHHSMSQMPRNEDPDFPRKSVTDDIIETTQTFRDIKSSLQFFSIDLEKIDTPIQKDEKLALLGFQGVYFEDVSADLSSTNKDCQSFKNYLDSEFFNPGLSISGCIAKESNRWMLTYVGNTSCGCSGSCLVDKDGAIKAVTFAHYEDNPNEEEKKEEEKLIAKFIGKEIDGLVYKDVDLELKESKKVQSMVKNRNLAMCISHDIVKEFLEGWKKEKHRETDFSNFKEKLFGIQEQLNKSMKKFENESEVKALNRASSRLSQGLKGSSGKILRMKGDLSENKKQKVKRPKKERKKINKKS